MLSTSPASVMSRRITAGTSYPPSEKISIVLILVILALVAVVPALAERVAVTESMNCDINRVVRRLTCGE